ncbi:hypothetical protein [Amycolatopsis sp. cmx-8-4]
MFPQRNAALARAVQARDQRREAGQLRFTKLSPTRGRVWLALREAL